jgi:parallel beta-helix repeat protein
LKKRLFIGLLLFLLVVRINQSVTFLVCAGSVIRVPEDYPTIQEAINSANPGDTILVAPGTYYENIIINKPILLIGESKETTIIKGLGTDDVAHISSDRVKISGFTIKGSGTKYIGPFSGGDAGIELDHVVNCSVFNLIVTGNTLGISLVFSKNNLIANNLVISNGAEGIFLVSSNNNLIINNTCNSNGMHGGIWLALSSGNAIINNTANFNLDIGIKLHTSSNNMVENNVCLNNKHVGIFLRSSSNNTLTHNTCNSNDQPGIYLESSCNNMLKNNICKFNTDWGIVLRTSSNHNIVINNTSSNNNYGIDLKSSVGNTLVNNIFSSNNIGITFENSSNNKAFYNIISMNMIGVGIGVIEVEGTKFGNLTGNEINMNDIYENAQFGILNEFPTEVNATLNWWGDRSGPHHPTSNPNGKGDRVSENVLFKPWLTAPIERAPVIEQTSPHEDAYLSTPMVNFSAEIIGNVEKAMVVVDGEEYDMALNEETNLYEATLSLAEGVHIWYVKVEDMFGNMGSIPERNLVVDITSPTASINAPADRSYLKGTVTITTSGYDINFEKMEFYISDNLVKIWTTGGTQTYDWDTTLYIDSPYSLRVIVYDKAGNSKSTEIMVTVDNTPPNVKITSPISGALIEKDTIIVIWRVDDATSGIAKTEISLDDGAWIDVTGETSYTFTNLTEGGHHVRLRTIDNAKNVAEDSVEFTIRIPSLPWELYVATIVAGTIIIGVATVLYKRRHAIEKVFKKK